MDLGLGALFSFGIMLEYVGYTVGIRTYLDNDEKFYLARLERNAHARLDNNSWQ